MMERFPAWVEVDLDAMKRNIETIRGLVGLDVRILLVVKADAYGHGSVRTSRFAESCGVNMLGVATCDEGKELRQAGIGLPILILSPVLPAELDAVLENGLAVTASSCDFALEASCAAKRRGVPCRLHIEVDTGMGRAGLPQGSALEAIRRIKGLEFLHLEGIFTHFPASDSDMDFTAEQIRSFVSIVDECRRLGITFEFVHCANSAAVLNFPRSHFNMIRPGLLVYGHVPSVVLKDKVAVTPVMRFKTKLVLVRDMPAGASISYGRTFITRAPMKMGIIPVGYGHGLSHRLSNVGYVLYGGSRVPIVGRVTMDMTMVDLSAFPHPQVGDEVVIFGRQGEAEISADDVAQWDGTLNYEVLCRISKRVVRIYLHNGRIDSMKTLLGVHEGA